MKKKQTKRQSLFVPITKCRPNKWNPRGMNPQEFVSLKESLKSYGQDKPIQVWEVKDGYEILGGYHTWKAMKEVGFKEIEVNIQKFANKEEAMIFSLADNIHGNDSLALLGKAVYELHEKGYSIKQIARSSGKDEAELKDALEIAQKELAEKLKKTIEKLKKENFVVMNFITDENSKESMNCFIKEVTGFAHSKGVEVEEVKQQINPDRVTVALVTFNVTAPQHKVIKSALEKLIKEESVSETRALELICADFLAGH